MQDEKSKTCGRKVSILDTRFTSTQQQPPVVQCLPVTSRVPSAVGNPVRRGLSFPVSYAWEDP